MSEREGPEKWSQRERVRVCERESQTERERERERDMLSPTKTRESHQHEMLWSNTTVTAVRPYASNATQTPRSSVVKLADPHPKQRVEGLRGTEIRGC